MGFFSSLFGGSQKMDRREYNAKVDQIIRNDFGIVPQSSVDSRFPGALAYLELIDAAYYDNGSPEQAALRVLIPFFSGLHKSGVEKDRSDANILFEKIKKNMHSYLARGVLSQYKFDGYSALIKKHTGHVV